MKKIISLFLVAIMSLSIVACGSGEKYVSDEEFLSYIEVVELTSENYMDYLEFVEADTLDDFGEPTGDKYMGLKLKEGYNVVKEEALVKVAYTTVETEFKLDEKSKEWVETFPDSEGWTNSDEIDLSLWYDDDVLHIYNTHSESDNYIWEYEFTDLKITKVSGLIFKADIPDELWQTNDEGDSFFITGTKEANHKVVKKEDDPKYLISRLSYAIEKALLRQGKEVEAKVYDIEYPEEPVTNEESSEPEEPEILTAFDGKSPKIPSAAFPDYLEVVEITAENWKDYFEVVYDENWKNYELSSKAFSYDTTNLKLELKVIKEDSPLNGETVNPIEEFLVSAYYNEKGLEYTIDDFECVNAQGKLIIANIPEELWGTNGDDTVVYIGSDSGEQWLIQGKATSLAKFLN